jgi:hypothetical protein
VMVVQAAVRLVSVPLGPALCPGGSAAGAVSVGDLHRGSPVWLQWEQQGRPSLGSLLRRSHSPLLALQFEQWVSWRGSMGMGLSFEVVGLV